MEKRALTDPIYVRSNPTIKMFLGSFYGKPGTWRAFFSTVKQPWHPLSKKASTQHWRKKVKEYSKLVRDEGESRRGLSGLFPSTPEQTIFLTQLAKRNEGLEIPVSASWMKFEEVLEFLKTETEDNHLIAYYEFLASLEDRRFDLEEMLMWMLCAYLKLLHMTQQLSDEDKMGILHVDVWMPLAEGDELCTTRYRVISHLFEVRNSRTYRHLRGTRRLHNQLSAKNYRKFSVKHALLEVNKSYHDKAGENSGLNQDHYKLLFRFVHFFEWMQLDMLCKSLPAKRIEESFSRLPDIQKALQNEFDLFELQTNNHG